MNEAEQEFVFEGIEARPVPSLLRGLSAPVHLSVEGQTDEDLLLLLANDTGERDCSGWGGGGLLGCMVCLLQSRVYMCAKLMMRSPV